MYTTYPIAQGCPLAPLFYNPFMDDLLCRLHDERGPALVRLLLIALTIAVDTRGSLLMVPPWWLLPAATNSASALEVFANGGPEPNQLWNDLLQLLHFGTASIAPLFRCCDFDPFDALCVRKPCAPWVLDPPVCCQRLTAHAAWVRKDIASQLRLLAGASMPGAHALTANRCVQTLQLTDWSRVPRRCIDPSHPLVGAEVEALSRCTVVEPPCICSSYRECNSSVQMA
jgi:hypothetical protein